MALYETATATLDNVVDIAEARKAKEAPKPKKKRAPSNRNIDYEKVAKLKAEIEAGTYKMDAARIADKFVEREGK